MNRYFFFLTSALATAPLLAYARCQPRSEGLFSLICTLTVAISSGLVPLIFGLAVIFFFWGMARFILTAGDEKGRTEGKRLMLWGVIALSVAVAIFGLIGLIGYVLEIPQGGILQQIPVKGN